MKFLRTHKEQIIIFIILAMAAFLRLYRIGDYMTFLGDEGRDVLVAKGILNGQLTLLGPRSSAGNFFTGPIYYYMIAPFLWLFNYNPVGPAVMIALLGIGTVYLIFYIGKRFFNPATGLIAASLYATSPLVINYSHSSWNPNAMPFFTILLLYFLYLAVKTNKTILFFTCGFLFGITLQLHYIELFVGVTIFFFILIGQWVYSKMINWKAIFKQYAVVLAGFLLGFLPFIVFEIRHEFINLRTIAYFIILGDPGAVDLTHKGFFQIIGDVFFRFFAKTLWFYPQPGLSQLPSASWLMYGLGGFILIIAIWSIINVFKLKDKLALLLLLLWLGFGIGLFGFYKKPINDYNFEFMFPLPFFLIAYLIVTLFKRSKEYNAGKFFGVLLFAFLLGNNLFHNPFRLEPNRQKHQAELISDFVIAKTNSEPFNFALLTPGNSDHAYRYFFEIKGRKPVMIDNTLNDPKRKTVTKQLLIVCEDVSCKPLGNPLFEVAGFGRAKIVGEWNVSVVKVYKLIPY